MKKLFLTCLSFCLFFSTVVVAQAPVKQWDVTLGGTGNDILYHTFQTTDGGYIVCGVSTTSASGDVTDSSKGGADYWIIKLDSSGVKEWDNLLGGSGNESASKIIQTADGGYLVGGWSMSGISGDKSQNNRGGYDYWIVKLNYAGVKQWDARYGGDQDDQMLDMVTTSDGGYLLGGRSYSAISGDRTESNQGSADYWLVKVNSLGVKQWDKRFGGNLEDYLSSLIKTNDGGYLLGGSSLSILSGDKTKNKVGSSGNDYWVVKINSSGVKQWDVVFGGTGNDALSAMKNSSDGGFILGGQSNSIISGNKTQNSKGSDDYWIVKISSTGSFQWDATLGGTLNDNLYSIEQTIDGGYVLGGSSSSDSTGDRNITSRGSADYWIVKLNSVGMKQWDNAFGGNNDDNLKTVMPTSDGGYIIGGYSTSGISGEKSQVAKGIYDFWLVKAGSYITPAIYTGSLGPQFCCPGKSLIVPYTTAGVFNPGNVFTAQLSDSLGNFTIPINIGTITNTLSGNIQAIIPKTANAGSAYRIRVVSSNPMVIGSLNNYNLSIEKPATPTFTISGVVLTSSTAHTYQWNYNDTAITGANAQTYAVTKDGNYSVSIADINGCWATSTTQTINISNPSITTLSDSDSSFCIGEPVNVEFSIIGAFLTGNTFTAQLSDSTGSFLNPENIGSINSQTPSTIYATIPITVAAGTKYRIRVIANNPPTIGTDNGSPLDIKTITIPTITVNGNILTASEGLAYRWFLNMEEILGTTTRSITITQNGEYVVMVTDINACGIGSAMVNITSFEPPDPVKKIIAAGGYHSIYSCSDGLANAVGKGNDAQLGNGTWISSPTPVLVSGLTGITSVAAGEHHSIFVKNDGTVWACGQNGPGQLGDGTTINKSIPAKAIGLTGIIAAAGGRAHSLFLKDDGSVWAVGLNLNGQLGDGTIVSQSTPIQIVALTGIIEVATGAYHSLFLKNDGTVWAVGHNYYGQLGDGTTIDKLTPVKVSGLSGITAISAGGGSHSLFLKNDGTVWAVGENWWGQLGDGTGGDIGDYQSTAVQVSGLSEIIAVSAGWGHSLFLKSDGTVWSVGGNQYSQLGDGTTTDHSVPLKVKDLTGIIAISAGGNHSLFLKNDNTVWAVGKNSDGGQLGDGTTISKSTPVKVTGLCSIGVGIENNSIENNISIYPNPTNGKITVQTGHLTITKITVINQLGAVVLTATHASEIDLSGFPSGMYMLEIECGEKRMMGKVVR